MGQVCLNTKTNIVYVVKMVMYTSDMILTSVVIQMNLRIHSALTIASDSVTLISVNSLLPAGTDNCGASNGQVKSETGILETAAVRNKSGLQLIDSFNV
jgi:hypothetical protein